MFFTALCNDLTSVVPDYAVKYYNIHCKTQASKMYGNKLPISRIGETDGCFLCAAFMRRLFMSFLLAMPVLPVYCSIIFHSTCSQSTDCFSLFR